MIERLERDKNLLEKEKKQLIVQKEKLKAKADKLEYADYLLELVEKYINERKEVLNGVNKKDFKLATIELEKISKNIKEAKKIIKEKSDERF